MAASHGVTTVNLAGSNAKKVQTTDDILKAIESTMPDASQQHLRAGELSAQMQGRCGQPS